MYEYFNIILLILQLRTQQQSDISTTPSPSIANNVFIGNTHDVYITDSTNIYIAPGEY